MAGVSGRGGEVLFVVIRERGRLLPSQNDLPAIGRRGADIGQQGCPNWRSWHRDLKKLNRLHQPDVAHAFAKARRPAQNMKAAIAPMPMRLGRPNASPLTIAAKPQSAAKK